MDFSPKHRKGKDFTRKGSASTFFKDCYDYIEFRCNNNTTAFSILKQYYTELTFNFIIYSNKKSLSVALLIIVGVSSVIIRSKNMFA